MMRKDYDMFMHSNVVSTEYLSSIETMFKIRCLRLSGSCRSAVVDHIMISGSRGGKRGKYK
jgi:hypothetical protein